MSIPVLITPTLILLAGLITDLRSRKIYNWLVLTCLAAAIAHSIYFFDFMPGLIQGAQGAGVALMLTLPMVLIGVLGAGDMKLLFAFGFATSYSATFSVVIYSFVWAAIFGLIYAIVSGRFKTMLLNMKDLAAGKKPEEAKLNHIPFTVAIVLAWGTYVFSLNGGSLW